MCSLSPRNAIAWWTLASSVPRIKSLLEGYRLFSVNVILLTWPATKISIFASAKKQFTGPNYITRPGKNDLLWLTLLETDVEFAKHTKYSQKRPHLTHFQVSHQLYVYWYMHRRAKQPDFLEFLQKSGITAVEPDRGPGYSCIFSHHPTIQAIIAISIDSLHGNERIYNNME